ncbi:hypothetical protein G7021_19260 [Pseudomonas carnis]|uniref:hypothetical protein n=1 Tax=Pseudomonas carnis TaxID=2487355 RepID=UPI0015E2B6ED|nr:hypothetical protein [Pseudomonas carnis]MBA1254796.1 hypothetical protein [Pseudomonas carnis]
MSTMDMAHWESRRNNEFVESVTYVAYVSPAFKNLHPKSPRKSCLLAERRFKEEKTACFFFVSIP